MNSHDNYIELKSMIDEMSVKMDDIYYSMRYELIKEVEARNVERIKDYDKAQKIYEKLDENICKSLVKQRLPFLTRLFNKVNYRGLELHPDGTIIINFYFNNPSKSFQMELKYNELQELLEENFKNIMRNVNCKGLY